jgi:hypothetical protein
MRWKKKSLNDFSAKECLHKGCLARCTDGQNQYMHSGSQIDVASIYLFHPQLSSPTCCSAAP